MTNYKVVSSAIESTLSKHLDEDTCDYIQSILAGDDDDDDDDNSPPNWSDPDTREAVQALVEGSGADGDMEALCQYFFQLLDESSSHSNSNANVNANANTDNNNRTKNPPQEEDVPLRKLTQSVTIKDKDIQTFAMGLIADTSDYNTPGNSSSNTKGTILSTTDAYDVEQIKSERKKRKERQKKMRIEQQEKERQRAIQDAMSMIHNNNDADEDGNPSDPFKHLFSTTTAGDINVDVHFRNFDLHNARADEAGAANQRGGGSDLLLSSANLTLSSNRRYGLMGRNGCGKTTLLNAIANRTYPNAVPKNMSILLVQQEIVGSELSALETVIQSDIKREALKRYIAWVESELERLENPNNNNNNNNAATEGEEKEDNTEENNNNTDKKSSKSSSSSSRGASVRERRERRRETAKSKSKQKQKQTTQKKQAPEDIAKQKLDLNEKLSLAYQKLVQVEEENGVNPEGRARRLLAGLGFSPELQDKPTKELSGGYVK